MTIEGAGRPDRRPCPSCSSTATSPRSASASATSAYSCDLSGLPDESLPALAGLDVWIVDALRYTPHPSHLSVAEALDWIERLKPQRAILTNLHADLDYDALRAELPPHVEPAYRRHADRGLIWRPWIIVAGPILNGSDLHARPDPGI